MADRKIKIYCILLSLLIMAAGFSVFTGETYARYENRVSIRTIIEKKPEEENKSFFVSSTENAPIVLLGEISKAGDSIELFFMPDEREADIEAKLYWSVSGSGYVTAQMRTAEGTPIENEDAVAGNETITLTVSTIDTAWTYPHSELNIDVTVSWNDLKGVFRVSLPAVSVSSGSGDSGDSGDTGDTGDSGEGVSLDSSETGDDTVTVSSEGGNGTVDNSGTDDTVTYGIKSVPAFDPEQYLPIAVTLEEEVTEVVFGLGGESHAAAFPAGTLFSLDGGKTFFMLCRDETIKIKASEITGPILFSFRNTDLFEETASEEAESTAEAESITILMESKKGAVSVASENSSVTVAVLAPEAFKITETEGDGSVDLTGEGEESQEAEGINTFVLDGSNSARFAFPAEWAELERSCSVQSLSVTTLLGVHIYDDTDEIAMKFPEENNCVIIGARGDFPPPGTYRVYMQWKFGGVCFYTSTTTFFVKYSAPSGSTYES